MIDAATLFAVLTGLFWAIGAIYSNYCQRAFGLPAPYFIYDVPRTIRSGILVFVSRWYIIVFVSVTLVILKFVEMNWPILQSNAQANYTIFLLAMIITLATILTIFAIMLTWLINIAAVNAVKMQKELFNERIEPMSTIFYEDTNKNRTSRKGYTLFYGDNFTIFYDDQSKIPVIVATRCIIEVVRDSSAS